MVAGAILVLGKLYSARKRRNLLIQRGQVSSWGEIEIKSERVNKIVQTDFGYGKEVWTFTAKANEIDLELRAFKTGNLVLPRPKLSDVENFCRSRGITIDLMIVK